MELIETIPEKPEVPNVPQHLDKHLGADSTMNPEPALQTTDEQPEKGISLDTKVDRLTAKMDWLMNFVANSKVETDAHNKLNDQKFTRVESAYNLMVDNLAQTSNNLSSCNKKIEHQALSIGSNEAGISSLQTN